MPGGPDGGPGGGPSGGPSGGPGGGPSPINPDMPNSDDDLHPDFLREKTPQKNFSERLDLYRSFIAYANIHFAKIHHLHLNSAHGRWLAGLEKKP